MCMLHEKYYRVSECGWNEWYDRKKYFYWHEKRKLCKGRI